MKTVQFFKANTCSVFTLLIGAAMFMACGQTKKSHVADEAKDSPAVSGTYSALVKDQDGKALFLTLNDDATYTLTKLDGKSPYVVKVCGDVKWDENKAGLTVTDADGNACHFAVSEEGVKTDDGKLLAKESSDLADMLAQRTYKNADDGNDLVFTVCKGKDLYLKNVKYNDFTADSLGVKSTSGDQVTFGNENTTLVMYLKSEKAELTNAGATKSFMLTAPVIKNYQDATDANVKMQLVFLAETSPIKLLFVNQDGMSRLLEGDVQGNAGAEYKDANYLFKVAGDKTVYAKDGKTSSLKEVK